MALRYHLRTEDELFVDTNYSILHEDEDIIVANKPAPLPIHAVGRFMKRNLLSILLAKKEYAGLSLHAVNRLDSETSGVVLIAKHKDAASFLAKQFEKRTVEKEYGGIVMGVPDPLEQTIAQPLLNVRTRNDFNFQTVHAQGKLSETTYRVVSTHDDYALVKFTPKTGRTHQIRAHMAFVGNPLVGDKVYIAPSVFESYIQMGWQEWMRATVVWSRLALHSTGLRVRHPRSRELVQYRSELPDIFHTFLSSRTVI